MTPLGSSHVPILPDTVSRTHNGHMISFQLTRGNGGNIHQL